MVTLQVLSAASQPPVIQVQVEGVPFVLTCHLTAAASPHLAVTRLTLVQPGEDQWPAPAERRGTHA
uniref:Uncharacterized protein n=1 Tax=Thermogemmatispora argillosa TaxID=2045280 RepID=A0A455SX07_9CHLR|nr:hypothetical protein KTA_02570 [Thermogemmatispora argillosa]